MSAPVWQLSVDLQTKTAAFTSGLGEAVRAAKSSFGEIKADAKDMGKEVSEGMGNASYSMGEARHSVMMLGETFGIHLPRGITSFIASLGPLGAALEAAFPWLAIILGATLLIEHLTKIGEAEEKLKENTEKMADSLAEGINKADQEIVNASIEIRKLAGDPAWDLLAKKMELQDAEKGIKNVTRLEAEIANLLKAAPATSNWNPFNWLDNSGEVANKAKALQEQLHGKGQDDQAGLLAGTLAAQTKILEQMKGQDDVSAVQLKNQQTYVDFLKQETELIQKQADAETLKDQASQGKDRADKIAKAEEAQQKLAEAQQRGADHRLMIEAGYAKKVEELRKHEGDEAEKLAGEQLRATDAVMKEIAEKEKEKARIAEEIGKEEAERTKKIAALNHQAREEAIKEDVKLEKLRGQGIIDALASAENEEYAQDMRALQNKLNALDKAGKDYEVKLKQIQDKEQELTQAHQNKLTQITTQAEEERDERVLSAYHKFQDDMARGMASVLMGHESAAKMLMGIGNEIATGMIENALKSIMANNMTKESDAAAAARKAYLAGMHFPFPVNIVMGPALGALAFASVMAFEEGGIVPGVGRGDVVPARLEPGEGVIPKKIMEGWKNAPSAPSDSGRSRHFHSTHNYHINALDRDGVEEVLKKHGETIARHVHGEIRRGAV